VIRVLRTALPSVAAAVLLFGFAAPAKAANTRISISNFQWSKNAEIDLGEYVIWDWIGPDTLHSVTGDSPNAPWDSDPGSLNKPHPLGDTFKVTFDQPGVYAFRCKLHASVAGTVTVTDTPGDPNSNPGPQPELNTDVTPPVLTSVFVTNPVVGPRGKGTGLSFQIGERGTVAADYYRVVRSGKGSKARWVRKFAGFDEWEAHVGNNIVNFARPVGTFTPRPGRYAALVWATDEFNNSTTLSTVKFQVNAGK
jgi:plastocyanin